MPILRQMSRFVTIGRIRRLGRIPWCLFMLEMAGCGLGWRG